MRWKPNKKRTLSCLALLLVFSLLMLLGGCMGNEPDYSDQNLDVSRLHKVYQYNYYRYQDLTGRAETAANAFLTSLGKDVDTAELSDLSAKFSAFGTLMQKKFSNETGAQQAGAYLSQLSKAFAFLAQDKRGQQTAMDFLNAADLAATLLDEMPKDASQMAQKALECTTWIASAAPREVSALLALTDSKSDDDTLVITLGGNTFLGNPEDRWEEGFNLAAANSKLGDYYPFLYCLPYFQQDDLTLVTYEGNLTTRDGAGESGYNGFASYATAMANSGIDVVCLATEHADDFYNQGRQDTIDAFAKAGISSYSDQSALFFNTKLGKIAFLSYDCISTKPDVAMILRQDIAKANANKADIIIVSFHWGKLDSATIQAYQQKYGKLASTYGADLVLGSHPYVLQGMEYTKLGRGIFYSLGNLCHGADAEGTYPDSAIVQVKVHRKNGKYDFTDYQVIPLVRSTLKGEEFMPVPALGADYHRIEQAILDGSAKLSDPIKALKKQN